MAKKKYLELEIDKDNDVAVIKDYKYNSGLENGVDEFILPQNPPATRSELGVQTYFDLRGDSGSITAEVSRDTLKCYNQENITSLSIHIPESFSYGSYGEIDFRSNTHLHDSSIEITCDIPETTVNIVNAGSTIGSQSYKPPADANISLLFVNNGINILCGVIEATRT